MFCVTSLVLTQAKPSATSFKVDDGDFATSCISISQECNGIRDKKRVQIWPKKEHFFFSGHIYYTVFLFP